MKLLLLITASPKEGTINILIDFRKAKNVGEVYHRT